MSPCLLVSTGKREEKNEKVLCSAHSPRLRLHRDGQERWRRSHQATTISAAMNVSATDDLTRASIGRRSSVFPVALLYMQTHLFASRTSCRRGRRARSPPCGEVAAVRTTSRVRPPGRVRFGSSRLAAAHRAVAAGGTSSSAGGWAAAAAGGEPESGDCCEQVSAGDLLPCLDCERAGGAPELLRAQPRLAGRGCRLRRRRLRDKVQACVDLLCSTRTVVCLCC